MASKKHKLGMLSGSIVENGDGTAGWLPPGRSAQRFRVRISDVTGFSVVKGRQGRERQLNVLGNGTLLGTAILDDPTARKIEQWFRSHPDFGKAPAPVAVVVEGGSVGSVADEVRKLAELREQGVLSEEEYAAAKQRALGGS